MTRSRTCILTAFTAFTEAIAQAARRRRDSVCTGSKPGESRHASSKFGNLFFPDDAFGGSQLVLGLRLKRAGSAQKHADFTERHHGVCNNFLNEIRQRILVQKNTWTKIVLNKYLHWNREKNENQNGYEHRERESKHDLVVDRLWYSTTMQQNHTNNNNLQKFKQNLKILNFGIKFQSLKF